MAENTFNDPRILTNPYQDPMGVDAQQGLERFLDKFHQPGVPSHTIITDPEYFVFLWFHNAVGNLIDCPYTVEGSFGDNYEPKLGCPGSGYGIINKPFESNVGIQGSGADTTLPPKCLDLTPFVRDASLPEIKPANGTSITTLFGQTTAGSFSPYASDGQQQITLQVIDTEYSILDAIFYPWMRDINSPWWYRPEKAVTDWATPYPMATLEVQRPRMRFSNERPNDKYKSRNENKRYQYYSYKFLGIKPVSYSAFSVNGAGSTNLLRNLTLSCDMCLVDLLNDTKTTDSSSVNLGNRTSFLFNDSSSTANSGQSGEQGKGEEEKEDEKKEEEKKNAEEEEKKTGDEQKQNDKDAEQQEKGDQPGEDEKEKKDGENKENPDNKEQSKDPDNEKKPAENSDKSANEKKDADNKDADAKDGKGEGDKEEKGFFGKIMDTVKDVGGKIVDGAKTAAGWVANGVDACLGLEPGTTSSAVGSAISSVGDMIGKAASAVGTVATSAANSLGIDFKNPMSIATSLASAIQNPIGAAAKLGAGVMGGIGQVLDSGNPEQPAQNQQSQTQQQPQQQSKSLGTEGQQVKQVANAGTTTTGVVQNGQSGSSTTLGGTIMNGLKTACSAVGSVVGGAGNIISGAFNVVKGLFGGSSTPTPEPQKKYARLLSAEPNDDDNIKYMGAMEQMIDAQNDVKQTNQLVNELNDAAIEIAEQIDSIGLVIDDLNSVKTESVGELKRVIDRMITGVGNKPSPISHYAELVENGGKS